jgi:esterase/lipase
LVSELEERLQDVRCPTLIIQADQDPVVDPESAAIVMKRLGSEHKRLEIVTSDRHGILYGDIGDTRKLIVEYLNKLSM